MKKNMSGLDQIIRLVIVVIIAILYVTGQISGIGTIILGLVAVAFLITGLIAWCPTYALFGISSRKEDKQ